MVQPKGLIATEGLVSIPVIKAQYPVLSVRSHFYEFIPLDNELEIATAWQVEKGGEYKVVITTAGGLYRYKLNDIVKVLGFYNDCPMLKFLGRGNQTSDFYGEKLHHLHISETFNIVFRNIDISSCYVLLAPDGEPAVDHYTLYFASDNIIESNTLKNICNSFELELRKNTHYDYCRKIGQLKKLEICHLEEGVDAANRIYMEVMKNRGIRDGDIKPALLDNRPVWKKEFSL